MKVLVLHDPVAPDARPDELDTLVQVREIGAALTRRGHTVATLAFGPDLAANERAIVAAHADVVFNLVESHLGRARLLTNATSLLECLGLPFTGAPGDATTLSTGKLITKRVLAAAGIPTPAWRELPRPGAPLADAQLPRGPWLVKSVWEHGSLGLETDSVFEPRSFAELDAAIRAKQSALGGEAFAEQYVHGREFNVALLAGDNGPRCLPIPEILFEYAADDDTPRIVGYRAKWAEGSAEFVGTPRRFDFEAHDAALLGELERQALATWHAFGCDGYVRVDFRVDAQGRVYVIDVNTNPCLSPDAGYAAALARAGIPYDVAIERIVLAALARRGVRPPAATAKEVAKRAPLAHTLRTDVRPSDAARVRAMCASTGFFNDEELDIAVELVDEHLAKGEVASGYSFVFLDGANGATLCYASYGRIAGTERAYDLFWIVTDDAHRGRGLGRIVLDEVERRIAALGGGQIHVETSSRAQYDPTRAFYERCGYFEAARFTDFYKAGDGKVVYVKTVEHPRVNPV